MDNCSHAATTPDLNMKSWYDMDLWASNTVQPCATLARLAGREQMNRARSVCGDQQLCPEKHGQDAQRGAPCYEVFFSILEWGEWRCTDGYCPSTEVFSPNGGAVIVWTSIRNELLVVGIAWVLCMLSTSFWLFCNWFTLKLQIYPPP